MCLFQTFFCSTNLFFSNFRQNINPCVEVVPPLTTLRQGIVVLSRQWKNVIYTPILIQYNMKTSGMKNLYQQEMNLEQVMIMMRVMMIIMMIIMMR